MLNIQKKIQFEDNCWVDEVDGSEFNMDEENRIKAVTDMASITKGMLGWELKGIDCTVMISERNGRKYAARKKLYKRLLTESAGTPSTLFEFVPIKSDRFTIISTEEIQNSAFAHNNFHRYCWEMFTLFNQYQLTNLRNILSNKINAKFNTSKEVKDFKIIVGKVPYEVIKYLGRKSAFSLICELDNATDENYKRYLNEVEFWYPSWWIEDDDLSCYLEAQDKSTANKALQLGATPEEATMELSDRRLVHFAMAAWKQDKNAWDNLFAVRGDNTDTMNITNQTINNIKTILKY